MDATWEEHQMLKRAERRLGFLHRLQEVINEIHATGNIDEIMLDLSRDIRALFSCDRMTLYVVTPCRTSIKSKIKTGMDSFKDFTLPITTSSIAGYVALHKRAFNIRNVYDAAELRSYSRELRFLEVVDKRTGYRSKEMVVTPIVSERNGELLGVLQLINNRMGGPFSELIEEGARELCRTLAVAFVRHMNEPVAATTRFDPLVSLGTLARPELELAKRSAQRKRLDLEDVLIDEFQVAPAALGAAYADFFGVAYEPFRSSRVPSALLQSLRREYVEHNGWLVLEEKGNSLVVLALDPVRLRASRAVENLFPGYGIKLCVTTRREFLQTVEQLYGAQATLPGVVVNEQALIERVQRIVGEALASAAPELQAVVQAECTQVVPLSVEANGIGTAGRRLAVSIELKLA